MRAQDIRLHKGYFVFFFQLCRQQLLYTIFFLYLLNLAKNNIFTETKPGQVSVVEVLGWPVASCFTAELKKKRGYMTENKQTNIYGGFLVRGHESSESTGEFQEECPASFSACITAVKLRFVHWHLCKKRPKQWGGSHVAAELINLSISQWPNCSCEEKQKTTMLCDASLLNEYQRISFTFDLWNNWRVHMLVCFARESDSQAGKENKEYGDGRAGIYSHCAAAGGRWVPTFSLSVGVCVEVSFNLKTTRLLMH